MFVSISSYKAETAYIFCKTEQGFTKFSLELAHFQVLAFNRNGRRPTVVLSYAVSHDDIHGEGTYRKLCRFPSAKSTGDLTVDHVLLEAGWKSVVSLLVFL